MPKMLPPHVELWRDRHGKVRVYFRKAKGPRIPLPAAIGSDEFNAAYAAAVSGGTSGAMQPERLQRDAPGTIGALIASYMKSAAYVELRSTTKIRYGENIEGLRTAHGNRPVSGLTRERIKTMLQSYAGKPGAGRTMLTMLRILIRQAIDIRWLTHDPSLGIKRPKLGKIRSWTDDEMAIFERRWPIGTMQRLAYALHLYTGQRRSDVHRMTWTDISGDTIRVDQQKTEAKLAIRLHRDLQAIIAATPRQHVTILNSELGRAFAVRGYSIWFRKAIKAAGLPMDCQPHGLRKAAGRRLAEAGCTAHQIMAVLGHKTLAEAERYTEEADQALLAKNGIERLENKPAQTTPTRFGQNAKKD